MDGFVSRCVGLVIFAEFAFLVPTHCDPTEILRLLSSGEVRQQEKAQDRNVRLTPLKNVVLVLKIERPNNEKCCPEF